MLLPYCAFHKHANSKVQKTPSQLCLSLPSIIITITSNEPWNTETHKTDRNPPITNHKPWPFEPFKVKFCFLRGPLRWMTAAKNAIVCWLLNFRIRMFVKSAVNLLLKTRFLEKKVLHGHLGNTVTSLLRPLFLAAGQSVYFELNTLSCQKNPYQYGHPLIRPNFFGPLVTVLTEFHRISNRKSTSWLL